jgi:hypothetical protein
MAWAQGPIGLEVRALLRRLLIVFQDCAASSLNLTRCPLDRNRRSCRVVAAGLPPSLGRCRWVAAGVQVAAGGHQSVVSLGAFPFFYLCYFGPSVSVVAAGW